MDSIRTSLTSGSALLLKKSPVFVNEQNGSMNIRKMDRWHSELEYSCTITVLIFFLLHDYF